MSDRLVCAHCAAPVAEGRCPVCRAARDRLRHVGLPATVVALLVALLAALAVLAAASQRYVFA